MDYGMIAGGAAVVLTILNIWKGSQEYNKAQREAGKKEERDENRDKEIRALWDKITEVDDVKQEIMKMSFRFEALELSIKNMITSLDKHIEKEGK